ncbi:sigma-70 family RNA polymerase sigma factor [Sphingobacterium sp. lm-10]|uniref:RNA polymerase sigma factor n=1 Tax=Sphingobacterium sp. lm-10 TaxID=2944904 RepID=UPI0020201591|nr:sigma-70 family RNA polymerase sigma factor [Sphingobacterium sp. lm-10]MCL7987830.1 sigma-70 family RNA polymerase sigma factor [Sphingobacterium sp. lm-10]
MQKNLTAISKGDESAFAAFYHAHFYRLATEVFHILKDKSQTEEVLQDVFTTIWNKREGILSIANLEGYLFVLARNASLNQLRRNIRRAKVEIDFVQQQDLWEEDTDETSAEERYLPWIDQAIAQLPAQQQKAFILCQFKRKKYLEIATEMNISRESVKKYLQLARLSIKTYLTKHRDSIVSLFFTFLIF